MRERWLKYATVFLFSKTEQNAKICTQNGGKMYLKCAVIE